MLPYVRDSTAVLNVLTLHPLFLSQTCHTASVPKHRQFWLTVNDTYSCIPKGYLILIIICTWQLCSLLFCN